MKKLILLGLLFSKVALATFFGDPVIPKSGGTGVDSSASTGVCIDSAGTWSFIAGTAGQVLTSNGAGVAPTFQATGGGSVTAVSVATANGFAGSSSGGATPALTLSTTITGLLKGNGTAISAASSGTDYELPLTFSTGLTRSTNTITVNTSQNIATLSNLTTNGFVKTSGGVGTLSVDTNSYLQTALTSAHLFVGNGSNIATDVAASGDVSLANTGAFTVVNSAITNAKLADMAQSTIKGRAAGAGTGAPTDLSATQATAILDNFVGDSGSGGTKGLVPAPSAGDAAAGKFLKADGSFAVPTGTGDFSSNTATSVDSEIVLFSGTGGKTGKRATGTGYAKITSGVLSAQSTPLPSADLNGGRTINAQTGTTYTFALADGSMAGGFPLVTASNASAQTYTIPTNASVAFPVGTQIDLEQVGAGLVTVAGAGGVTVNSYSGSLSLAGQYAAVSLIKRATDTWELLGNNASSAITGLTGDVTASGGGSVAATIAANAVTNAKFRQSAAQSLVGTAGNATANVADISSSAADQVMRSNGAGTSIGFGSIDLSKSATVGASILANANTTATNANTASTIVARDGSGNFTAGTITAALTGTASGNEVPLTFSTGLTRSTNTITVNTSQNISTLSNLTTNGFVKTSGGTGALSVQTSPIPTADINSSRTINAQTGTTYTLVLADGSSAGGHPLVTLSNASAITLTVPTNASVAFPVGTQVDIAQEGAGKVTVAGAGGVTVHSKSGNLALSAQYVGGTLVKTATDTWTLYGDLIP